MRLRKAILTGIVAAGFAINVPTALAELPNDVRTDQNAQQHAPAITQYVDSLVKTIRGNDAKAASDARRELCDQPQNKPGGPTVSASFQLTYAGIVDKAIQPMLKSEEVADRLNAAIIIYQLANATKSMSLQGSIQTLLNDESEAVALWGVKSAGAMIPTVLSLAANANNEKLTAGIVGAVKKHPTSGAIAQDAYRSLDVSGVTGLPPAGITKAVDAMNDLLAYRVELYVKGLPPDLQADRDPTNFLWKVVSTSPNSTPKSVQNLVNLLSVSAQRYIEAPNGEVRDRLRKVGEGAASSLIVIFQTLSKPEVVTAYSPLKNWGIGSPNQLLPATNSAVAETRKVASFSGVKDPPVVQPMPSATAGG